MRFCNKVGYRITHEVLDSEGNGTGVWKAEIIERTYKGDVMKNGYRYNNGESINDNVTITNSINILTKDNFAWSNFSSIIYVVWLNQKWKVSSVDSSQYPRLILTLGGVYNEAEN